MGITRRSLLQSCVRAALLSGPSAWAAKSGLPPLQKLLEQPESQVDYGAAALTIDRMADPTLDVSAAESQLNQLLKAAISVAGGSLLRGGSQVRIDALRTVLYEPGPWNDQRPFKYDLKNDPSGTKIFANKLLPNYLRSRLGNCVSMPALFLALGQRMGLDAHLSTAPEHTFVKIRREDGSYTNHECTSNAGEKRDASYVKEFEIVQAAMDQGTYLVPLSPKRALIQMSGTLAEHYYRTENLPMLHALADLLLQKDPRYVYPMLAKRSAYGLELNLRYRRKYKRFEDVPASEMGPLKELLRTLQQWDENVRALGWRPLSASFEQSYNRITKEAREQR
ncbi:transglutaminase family protein [Ramlibacter humi]|uniref:Protein SirB1 N-terminal domain-containing protein n=1 Tax=Ramlibacter humi TaxID=2530451 RepID=A0A4Z0BIA4_9BURK|nr:transglutaminase family protein [Ramlibacter humi]TFY99065.1 hypothetical protein EZ216_16020 [Ramlibacter humi]